MRRSRLAARAWLGLPLLLLAIAAPAPAPAQDASVLERLDRLERDLSMLQRQVYHGYPGAPAAPEGGGPAAVSVEIRMERLEAEMRDLTGRVEGAVNQVQQLRQRIEQINSDIAVRFGEMPAQSASGKTEATPAPANGPPPTAALSGPPGGAPAGGPHELRLPGATGAPPPAPAAASVGVLPSGPASAQYNYAFGLLKQADYAGAEVALREFVRRHPSDPLAGNAQYWLGETYYARDKYQDAAAAFAEGYKRYPHGTKAPDDLLKLGMSLARSHQRDNACLAFAQLEHQFPHSGTAIKDHAAAEKKRLGC